MATTTLRDLRRRTAHLLGDVLTATATSAGLTTTLIDVRGLAVPLDELRSREVVVMSGTASNLARTARVTTNSYDLRTITFEPALPAITAIGDVVDLYNERGVGWRAEEYRGAINEAIGSVREWALLDATAAIATAFDQASPVIVVPGTLSVVSGIEYLDAEGLWREIAPGRLSFSVAAGTMTVLPSGSWLADGRTVRLMGYAEQDDLDDDDETIAIHPEFLAYQAAASLLLGGAHRQQDPTAERRGLYFQQQADRLRAATRTRLAPNSYLVRR